MAQGKLRFSFEGSRGVSRLRWARTGAVMSNPLLSRSSTPEYCQGDCTGKVNQPCVGWLRSPASLDAVRSQPEVDTQDDDDDEQRSGGWVSARGSADQPLAHCAGAANASTVSGRQAELAPRLLLQGRNVAEYLAVLPSRDARVIAVLGVESSVCWIYGWTRRLTVPAVLALMHALRRGSG
jgi:hypothetical protein